MDPEKTIDEQINQELEAENTEKQGAEPAAVDEPKVEEPSAQPAEIQQPEGFQKRINKITADKYAEKRRADQLEEELRQFKQPNTQAVPAQEPTLEGFDYDDQKYQQALIDHRIQKGLSEYDQRRNEQRQADDNKKVVADFSQRVAKANIDGYQEAVESLNQSVALPNNILDVIVRAENGPELAFYLGKNLDVADEVANSPLGIMRLGEISANLKSGAKQKTELPSAPNPVNPLQGGGSSVEKTKEELITGASMDEVMNIKV